MGTLMNDELTPAEAASKAALDAMQHCLENGQSFRLEAGAGAGKTYSLIKALQFLIEKYQYEMPRLNQQIACITFTNVAKDEIQARTDKNSLVFCETNHAFCWALINRFQKQLRTLILDIPKWVELLAKEGIDAVGDRDIEYSQGYRYVRDTKLSIHHDDVLPLTIALMQNAKFRKLMTNRFPIILIDEYQDTDSDWIEAIKTHFIGQQDSPLFGFFGDHWQKIYPGGCGILNHPALIVIGKQANFRSVATVVDCLNRMRPELTQFVQNPADIGQVKVFHTNGWHGTRQAGAHWAGDLPAEVAHETLERVKAKLQQADWEFTAEKTKILMLTHRVLANEQGYSNLPNIYKYSESFTNKEDTCIAFFVDILEPACEAFEDHKFGAMFDALGGNLPLLKSHKNKTEWFQAMEGLMEIRANGSVGQVIDYLQQHKKPRLPDAIVDREKQLREFDPESDAEIPRLLLELDKLHAVSYKEIIALRKYLAGFSPFETKHGVKGAEFENVLVVVGRGWNHYNFGEMLELVSADAVPQNRQATFERSRNLFYVACSRPKKRLAILFTQQLSANALNTLSDWFLPQALDAINFNN
jgi:DNA helicase II / ATP-dependent DNA helicase PcrA